MSARLILAGLFTLVATASGCVCGRQKVEVTAESSTSSTSASVSSSTSAGPEVDFDLFRATLVAFGATVPLPVSHEFQEEVLALGPPIDRASQLRGLGTPLRIRVARDVPYGQLTRLMQAAIGVRVMEWDVTSTGEDGTRESMRVMTPGPMPRGECYATGWVGPDARVQVGIDQKGIIVHGRDGRVFGEAVVTVLRRLDPKCTEGIFRIYSQASARFGPVFDLARAVLHASPKPKISRIQFAVPSLGPIDAPTEFVR